MKKLLALLLAILMVVGTLSLVACGDEKDDGGKEQEQGQTGDNDKPADTDPSGDKEPTGDTDPSGEPDEYASETEAEQAKLQSLFDSIDAGGETINLVLDHSWIIEEDTEYNDGDVVQVALFNRQKTVEDNLGIIFNSVENGGAGSIASMLDTDVSSNTGEYHIVDGHMKFDANAAIAGCCLNLNRLSNLDLTKDYWNQSYTEKWSYKTLQYWTTGDITHGFLSILIACFVNADYWTESFPDIDIYAMVEDGKWTIEKAAEIITLFGYTDEDGDQTRSDGDIYAWVCQNGWTISSLAYGAGYSMTTKSGTKYQLEMATPEKEVLYSKLLAMTNQNGFIRMTNGEEKKPMENGLCLITHERLYRMDQYRSMTTPYYVIPLPKASEEADYQTPSYDGVPVVGCTAALSRDLYDVVGAVLETMAIQGKQDVTIAYYEKALQAKYARDEGSFRCLDIIRSTGWCDFGFAWCQYIAGIDTVIGDALQQKMASISQKDAEYGTVYTKNIDAMYAKLNKLEKADKAAQ